MEQKQYLLPHRPKFEEREVVAAQKQDRGFSLSPWPPSWGGYN